MSRGRRVAVVAHRGKVLDGGLGELRAVLREHGVTDPRWYEVDKSRQAPAKARKAVEKGAKVLFVWGGDGTVQRCVDVVAGTGTALAILPAGTANTVAAHLGVPSDLRGAVAVGLEGRRRRIDVLNANGERGALMAGAGFDAELFAGVDGALKRRFGRAAYVWSALRTLRARRRGVTVDVDGHRWFAGAASCVLVRNLPRMFGGLELAPGARPDDGIIEVGVFTARGPWQWLRVLARLVRGRFADSPFTHLTTARRVDVRFHARTRYELDGGDRARTRRLTVAVEPAALVVRVPDAPT